MKPSSRTLMPLEGHQPGVWPSGLRQNDLLPRLNVVQQPGEMGLCFMNVHDTWSWTKSIN